MKKLLGIVVFGLLLSNISNAELITLTKCYITEDQQNVPDKVYTYKNFKEQLADPRIIYENRLYTLDTVTEVITRTIVWKDSYIDREKKSGRILKKFSKIIFKIVDLGGNVASGVDIDLGSTWKEHTVDVDFVSNKVYGYSKADFGNGNIFERATTEQCKRQK